jgi:UDP-N-acetyl-D-mannosaminuronic acid dehydrogenase
VGGHCIPVDPWFLVGDYPEQANLVRLALQVNASMPARVLARAREAMAASGISDASRVGVYGLSYKADVDDVRESPTLQLLEARDGLLCGGPLRVYDPWVERDVVPGQVHSMGEFLEGLEMVVVMVGHSQVRGRPEAFGGRVLVDPCDAMGDGPGVWKL